MELLLTSIHCFVDDRISNFAFEFLESIEIVGELDLREPSALDRGVAVLVKEIPKDWSPAGALEDLINQAHSSRLLAPDDYVSSTAAQPR